MLDVILIILTCSGWAPVFFALKSVDILILKQKILMTFCFCVKLTTCNYEFEYLRFYGHILIIQNNAPTVEPFIAPEILRILVKNLLNPFFIE